MEVNVTTTDTSGIAGAIMAFVAGYLLVLLLVLVFMLVCMWRIFAKAGKPGWAALVPIYNVVVLLQVIEKPIWWLLFFLAAFIPYVGPVVALVGSLLVSLELAKKFGKSPVFGIVGLWLFGIVGYPMLAFGGAQYQTGAAPVAPVNVAPPTEPPVPPTPQV
jgi:hypothetical protein